MQPIKAHNVLSSLRATTTLNTPQPTHYVHVKLLLWSFFLYTVPTRLPFPLCYASYIAKCGMSPRSPSPVVDVAQAPVLIHPHPHPHPHPLTEHVPLTTSEGDGARAASSEPSNRRRRG